MQGSNPAPPNPCRSLLADLDAFEANLTTLNSSTIQDTRQRIIAFNSTVAAVVNASANHRAALVELNSSVAALPDLRRLASTFEATEVRERRPMASAPSPPSRTGPGLTLRCNPPFRVLA